MPLLADLNGSALRPASMPDHLDVRNFMQDGKGNLVVLDPIVCFELIGLIRANNEQRYTDRQKRQKWANQHEY